MPLTDVQIKNTKAPAQGEKPIKLSDGGGLTLEIRPSGARIWRQRVRDGGRDTTVVLGRYPKMGLKAARAAHQIAKYAPPAAHDSDPHPSPIFEKVAREWHALSSESRWGERHACNVLRRLEKQVFPILGARSIDQVRAPEIKDLLKGIEARGALDVMHDVRGYIESIFKFAVASGYRDSSPAIGMLEVIRPIPESEPMAAILTLEGARKLLAAVEGIPAFPVPRLANRFLALTAQRPGEVRHAEWSEFEGLDGPEPIWVIPAAKMKMGRPHEVPLTAQAADLLRITRDLTGRQRFVFTGQKSVLKPMSENTIGNLLNRAGYTGQHVAHGWRSTFSTIMNERRRDDADVIDAMLSHLKRDKVEQAYNRAKHLPLRRLIAQEWADILLVGAAPPAELLDLPKRSLIAI